MHARITRTTDDRRTQACQARSDLAQTEQPACQLKQQARIGFLKTGGSQHLFRGRANSALLQVESRQPQACGQLQFWLRQEALERHALGLRTATRRGISPAPSLDRLRLHGMPGRNQRTLCQPASRYCRSASIGSSCEALRAG